MQNNQQCLTDMKKSATKERGMSVKNEFQRNEFFYGVIHVPE